MLEIGVARRTPVRETASIVRCLTVKLSYSTFPVKPGVNNFGKTRSTDDTMMHEQPAGGVGDRVAWDGCANWCAGAWVGVHSMLNAG